MIKPEIKGQDYANFITWWTTFRGYVKQQPTLRNIWQYFQRDFPREEIAKGIQRVLSFHPNDRQSSRLIENALLARLERLWPGDHDEKVCPDCKEKPQITYPKFEYKVDQRQGQQRVRITETVTIIGNGPTQTGFVVRNTFGGTRHIGIDSRKSDRRSKILTGSLKAMRPQDD